MKKIGMYEVSVVLFFLLVPGVAFCVEYFCLESGNANSIMLKWAVFGMVGLRLGSAGIKQVLTPEFTAEEIFGITDKKAVPIAREIGFANISFGAIGIIALFVGSFRLPAAIAGGLYLGFAGCTHLINRNRNSSEVFPMVTDLWAFLVLLVCTLANTL